MAPYVGSSVRRPEDGRLVSGQGRYLDDLRVAGLLYLAFVRSTYAHARLLGVDLTQARSLPGVIGAYTLNDLGPINDLPAVPRRRS